MKDEKISALTEELEVENEKRLNSEKFQQSLAYDGELNEIKISTKNQICNKIWTEEENEIINAKMEKLKQEEMNLNILESFDLRKAHSTENFRKEAKRGMKNIKEILKEAYVKDQIRNKNISRLIDQLNRKDKLLKSIERENEDLKLKNDTLKTLIENLDHDKGSRKNINELEYIKGKDIQIENLSKEVEHVKEKMKKEINDLKEVISLKNLSISELNSTINSLKSQEHEQVPIPLSRDLDLKNISMLETQLETKNKEIELLKLRLEISKKQNMDKKIGSGKSGLEASPDEKMSNLVNQLIVKNEELEKLLNEYQKREIDLSRECERIQGEIQKVVILKEKVDPKSGEKKERIEEEDIHIKIEYENLKTKNDVLTREIDRIKKEKEEN